MAMSVRQMLVPLAFSAYSPHTLDHAIRLANHQVQMTLLHVMRAPTLAGTPPVGAGVALSPLLAAQEVDLHHALETCAERVWEAGLACEAILTRGTPLQRITEVAESRPIDFMIMGAHQHKGLQGLLRGRLAKQVVRLAPCPVWFAPSSTSATASPQGSKVESLDEWRNGGWVMPDNR